MMKNSYCHGHVIHHRKHPKKHRFKYHMSWCLFDLSQLEKTMAKSRWFSLNCFNVISIKDRDYINDNNCSVDEKIHEYLQSQTQQPFKGRVFLFTHPRFVGAGFNSVNFYLCHENDQLTYIVSEINNTPWGQKHLYFHNLKQDQQHPNDAIFCFKKSFHISPFTQMDIDYTWKFQLTDEQFNVSMRLQKNNQDIMNVVLKTQLQPMTNNNQLKWLITRPFQGIKMLTGIYWQATKIWLKGIPFFSHPKSQKTT